MLSKRLATFLCLSSQFLSLEVKSWFAYVKLYMYTKSKLYIFYVIFGKKSLGYLYVSLLFHTYLIILVENFICDIATYLVWMSSLKV